MDAYNYYKVLTPGGTTNLYGTEITKVCLSSININKNLVGTLTIKSGATTIGTIAIGSSVGQYWYTDNGVVIDSLNIVSSSASDDVTCFLRNI